MLAMYTEGSLSCSGFSRILKVFAVGLAFAAGHIICISSFHPFKMICTVWDELHVLKFIVPLPRQLNWTNDYRVCNMCPDSML
jgi:hypothetical protein